MSHQTFESIAQLVADQEQAPARNQTAELPGLVALYGVQQNKYEPITDEEKGTKPEHVEAPAPSLDKVLTGILKDYRNGLFYSLRDQVPFYYPPLPDVVITNGKSDGAPTDAPPN